MKIEDIYKDLPSLDTERLNLRKFTMDDVSDMFDYSSKSNVSRFVPWETHKSIKDTTDFLNYILNQYNLGRLAPWAIEYKQNNKVIGTIDFVAWSTSHYRAEIGFILSNDYWGKGLIVEAASKVIEFGFENMELNKIEAPCMVENVQSQRVLQKLGMRLEGISKEKYFIKDKFRDMASYSILKKEYKEQKELHH